MRPENGSDSALSPPSGRFAPPLVHTLRVRLYQPCWTAPRCHHPLAGTPNPIRPRMRAAPDKPVSVRAGRGMRGAR